MACLRAGIEPASVASTETLEVGLFRLRLPLREAERGARSVLMRAQACPAGVLRRGWSLTQADVVFCALPIVLFLSIVSFV